MRILIPVIAGIVLTTCLASREPGCEQPGVTFVLPPTGSSLHASTVRPLGPVVMSYALQCPDLVRALGLEISLWAIGGPRDPMWQHDDPVSAEHAPLSPVLARPGACRLLLNYGNRPYAVLLYDTALLD